MTIEIPDEDVRLAEQKLDGKGVPLEHRLAVFLHTALLNLQPVNKPTPRTVVAGILEGTRLSHSEPPGSESGDDSGQVLREAVERIRQRGAHHRLPEGYTIEAMIREGRA